MYFKLIPLLVVCLFTSQAYAVCEHQRSELADWNNKCETLSSTSQGLGVVGGAMAIFTFGLSLIPAGVAGLTAQNACRIRDEKRFNLEQCENQERARATESVNQARRHQERVAKIYARQQRSNELFAQKSAEAATRAEQRIQAFIQTFKEEGWDSTSRESVNFINQTRTLIEKERDQEIDGYALETRKDIMGGERNCTSMCCVNKSCD